MSNRRALGRGLNSLIPDNTNKEKDQITDVSSYKKVNNSSIENNENTNQTIVNTKGEVISKLPLEKINARSNQPRKTFNDESLKDLASSIKEYGLLNPIVVTQKGDSYEILAGERRYRASKLIGAKKIDVIIKKFDDKDVDVLSLVENIQREDLKPLEEASAYKSLADKHKMTQEDIAKTVGKSRSYIANTLRLLKLNEFEKKALNEGKISPSQARTLLSISGTEQRSQILNDFIKGTTNIRKVEKKTSQSKIKATNERSSTSAQNIDDILFEDLE